jgi:3-carboxy-cis,cis-muconate cycloisomerase
MNERNSHAHQRHQQPDLPRHLRLPRHARGLVGRVSHNPISCCYIHACAASVRQGVAALLDAVVEDHERATGPWEVEWITLPEIFTLAGGALAQACFVLEGLEVHADQMRANLDLTHGMIVSEAVMMGLAPKMGRDKAHDVLYAIIHDPALGNKSLAEMLLRRDDVTAVLSEAEIRRLTDPTNYLGLSEVMVDRVLAGTRG